LKINCCIIEDEEPAIELLSFFIEQHPHLELQHVFHNPTAITAEILNGELLFFLDINMPFKSGLDFLKEQQSIKKIPVIFTTSYSQHALEAYNLSVIDYLLKPFSKARFTEAVDKAIAYYTAAQLSKTEKHIWVNDDYKKVKIDAADILYIESDKQYVKIYTEAKRYMIIQTLKSLEDELSNSGFIRCHKSFLVNKKHITRFNSSSIYLKNIELPIGKQFISSLEALK
jgi:DNA-binding LytR/AlgR family response regulator